MARLRYNGLTATLDATGLTAAATSIGFTTALSSMAGTVPTITGSDYIPLVIDNEIVYLTAYTSGALSGTITRAQESTTAATHAAGATVENAPTVADFTAASGSGVLAVTEATTSAAYSTTSTTDTDVDATNLAVTFTVPASGRVLISLEGYCSFSSGGGLLWSLRTTAGVTVKEISMHANAVATLERRRAQFVVSGLTPGDSVTYRWGWHYIGTAGTANMYTGGNSGTSGNAAMVVTAAP